MTINWFPGHMNKARRELAAALAKIDVVIELLDARLPRSSRNPMLEQLRGPKPCLVVLNKTDLADPAVTQLWLEELARDVGPGDARTRCVGVDADRKASIRRLPELCRALVPDRRGPGRTVRCMVVGIPNVGKSTLINTWVGKRIARVGDRPAVTRQQQHVHLGGGISLSDTPGVLWPKLEDQTVALRLAASGAIRDTAYDSIEVACFAVRLLVERYPKLLLARFALDGLAGESRAQLDAIGRSRGFLQRGGTVDLERTADTLLHELRTGRIGRISFESPALRDAEPQ